MSAVREAVIFEDVEVHEEGRGPMPGAETASRSEEGTPANLAIALAVGQLTIDAAPADWTKTLTLVERAAATIRAYEKRFLQLEKQSKALADRAAEDQHRLHNHIQALEERLKQTEERVIAAEAATRDAEYHEWEAEMRVKRAEQRAVEAEAKAQQTEAYLRRVHELLSGVS